MEDGDIWIRNSKLKTSQRQGIRCPGDGLLEKIYPRYAFSNRINTISDFVPTRSGGPHVPAPLLV